jgi:hypothetical protein
MVQPLQADLRQAQTDLSRLGKARAALERAAIDGEQLQATLDRVRGRIDQLECVGKQAVLDALAVEIWVTGYQLCPSCSGRGYQPLSSPGGRRWPDVCPTCLRMRQIPTLRVEVTAPEALLTIVAAGAAHDRAAIAG